MPEQDEKQHQTNGHTKNSSGESATELTKPRSNRIKQAVQAARLQAFAFESAMALKQSCTSSVDGQLVMDAATAVCVHKLIGAWDTAADRLRILRGKGLPASVKSKSVKAPAQVQPLAE